MSMSEWSNKQRVVAIAATAAIALGPAHAIGEQHPDTGWGSAAEAWGGPSWSAESWVGSGLKHLFYADSATSAAGNAHNTTGLKASGPKTTHKNAKPAAPALTPLTPIAYHENKCFADNDKWSFKKELGTIVIFGVRGINGQTVNTWENNDLDAIELQVNPGNAAQFNKFKSSVSQINGLPLQVYANAEGGPTGPLNVLGNLADVPNESDVAHNMTPAAAETMMKAYGQKLNHAGVDIVLGPVVDQNVGSDALGDRAFGSKSAVILKYSKAYRDGLEAGGEHVVEKHFPRGLLGSTDDTLPVSPSITALHKQGAMKPFAALKNDPKASVLVSNDKVPGLTNGQPASLSPRTVEELVEREGLTKTVFITDNLADPGILGMPSINGSLAAAGIKAIEAGIVPLMIFPESVTDAGVNIRVRAFMAELSAKVRSGEISRAVVDTMASKVLASEGINPCK